MDLPLKLERFAFHYVDQKLDQPVYSEREVDVNTLLPVLHSFLLDMVAEIWDAPDAGSTRSARFSGAPEAEPVKLCLEALRNEEAGFFAASQRLADLLRQRSHPAASPGVLAVLRLRHPENGTRYVALLKIRHHDEQLVRFLQGNSPRLDVEKVENVLRKEIQKGALLPHPAKDDYEVKVIDAQSRDDPAAYFTGKFLGCHSKRSDDLQVRKLAPALERYADERQVTLAAEKLPQLLQHLQEQPEDITAPVLAEAVASENLFDDQVDPDAFIEFLDQANLGDLDIPKTEFERKRKGSRKVVYRFIDPDLDGLEISGPPEVLARILSSDKQGVTFAVRTGRNGFNFGYQ